MSDRVQFWASVEQLAASGPSVFVLVCWSHDSHRIFRQDDTPEQKMLHDTLKQLVAINAQTMSSESDQQLLSTQLLLEANFYLRKIRLLNELIAQHPEHPLAKQIKALLS